MTPLSLSQINRFSPAEFVAAFGGVFEHSPWLAERAFALRPATGFPGPSALVAALMACLHAASPEEKLALLNAHPELAGKEAAAGTLTQASTQEQASAGLNALTAADVERLRTLNARYRERFGFPFIIAVRNHTQAAIFGCLEARLHNSREMEINNALTQVAEIARLRLLAMLTE